MKNLCLIALLPALTCAFFLPISPLFQVDTDANAFVIDLKEICPVIHFAETELCNNTSSVTNPIPPQLCSLLSLLNHTFCQDETTEKGEKGEKHEINENQEPEYEIEYFCKKHTKISKYKIPTSELDIKKIRKMKLVDIKELIVKYNFANSLPVGSTSLPLVIEEKGEKGEKLVNKIVNTNSKTNSNTKDHLINMIKQELHNNYLEHIENVKAMDVDLITIGKNMMQELDKVMGVGGLEVGIDIAIIENQISTIASRMKTLQGMIAQYFIMKHTPHIEFISAANKLKMFMTKKKTTYTERKAESVEITAELLETKEEFSDFKGYLNKNKKKDDLADCFLQGIYYLTLKNMIKLV